MVTFLWLVLMTRKDVMLISPWNCISQNVLCLDMSAVFHLVLLSFVRKELFSLLLSKCCASDGIQEVLCLMCVG